MDSPRPNRKPFPRQYFVERLSRTIEVHQILRDGHEEYFRARNATGWRHDLGAQDVFLDNAGLIFQGQVDRDIWVEQMRDIKLLLQRWERLQEEVLQRKPWWGKNFNPAGRLANAGEPRSLLRFMGDADFAELEEGFSFLLDTANRVDPRRLDDWSPENFLDRASWPSERIEPRLFSGGVPLPPEWSPVVDRLRILPPSAATPDLPIRVGGQPADYAIYRNVVRDQGQLGACAANSIASALDIAGLRARPRSRITAANRVSAAWLHAKTGASRRDGRRLGAVAKFVDDEYLCAHELFPYPTHRAELQRWADDGWLPTDESVVADHVRLMDCWGKVEVRNLQRSGSELDVPKLKAHLAAGWVAVVAASHPVSVNKSPGLNTYGAVVTPPLGAARHAEGGHAWTVVGYDHIDGDARWKYQGHFLAMTSWGESFPVEQPFGPGIVALPFSYFLSEGFETWAFRFRQ